MSGLLKMIKVKYIGEDMAEIRNGEIYEATTIKGPAPAGSGEVLSVIDRSGEAYVYPKRLFEVIED